MKPTCTKCSDDDVLKLPISTGLKKDEIGVYACPKCGNVFCDIKNVI